MTDLAELRNEVNLTVRALLKSFSTPMTLDMLEKDYVIQVGRKIPFLKLGYTSLLDYLKSIPEVVNVEDGDNGIILKASDVVYTGQLPRKSKPLANGVELNRQQNANLLVSHHIQHKFYKYIKDRKSGVTVSEMEKFWQGGTTLVENGIHCSVQDFLQTSVTHLAYFKDGSIYPLNLNNVQVKGSVEDEGLPVLKLAMHVDDRTKKFLRTVLARHPEGINYSSFPEVYKQETGVYLDCRLWGYHSMLEMALHMPELFRCVQTSPCDWSLRDCRLPASIEQQFNIDESLSLQNGLHASTRTDVCCRCMCESKIAIVRRLYGNAEFLKTLKSSALTSEISCNKFHKIPQLRIPDNIIPGGSVQIHVSQVLSPEKFYFVLKGSKGKDVLDHLLGVMYEFYSTSHRLLRVSRDDVVEGVFCVVLYSGRCLRSQVLAPADGENVLVRFVDYGVDTSVDVDNLYYFHPAFGSFPQQALVGSLARVRPADTLRGWSREATLFLYDILVNSLVTAIVTAVDTEQQVMRAELIAEMDDQEYIYVGRKMTALGYALNDDSR